MTAHYEGIRYVLETTPDNVLSEGYFESEAEAKELRDDLVKSGYNVQMYTTQWTETKVPVSWVAARKGR